VTQRVQLAQTQPVVLQATQAYVAQPTQWYAQGRPVFQHSYDPTQHSGQQYVYSGTSYGNTQPSVWSHETQPSVWSLETLSVDEPRRASDVTWRPEDESQVLSDSGLSLGTDSDDSPAPSVE